MDQKQSSHSLGFASVRADPCYRPSDDANRMGQCTDARSVRDVRRILRTSPIYLVIDIENATDPIEELATSCEAHSDLWVLLRHGDTLSIGKTGSPRTAGACRRAISTNAREAYAFSPMATSRYRTVAKSNAL